MASSQLEMLAQVVLPSEILKYFDVVSVEKTSTEIHVHLDEKMSPELSGDVHFESKGFMEAVSVTDFPHTRPQGNIEDTPQTMGGCAYRQQLQPSPGLDVTAKGTRYSKEFGAFLKQTYGDVPRDLPYA